MKKTDKRVVLITASSEEEARAIGASLVEANLAACVNIVPKVRSIYRWEGKIMDEEESLLLVKTVQGKFDRLSAHVLKLHSYQTPEIVALPVTDGLKSYLDWVDDSLSG